MFRMTDSVSRLMPLGYLLGLLGSTKPYLLDSLVIPWLTPFPYTKNIYNNNLLGEDNSMTRLCGIAIDCCVQ